MRFAFRCSRLSWIVTLAVLWALPANGQWFTGALSEGRYDLAAGSLDGRTFFAGGWDNTGKGSTRVDIYTPGANPEWTQFELSVGRGGLAAATVGSLILFAGGTESESSHFPVDTVDVYDASVGPPTDPAAWSVAQLSVARGFMGATSVGDKVIFAGGSHSPGPTYYDVADIYDASVGPPSDPAAWSTATISLARGNIGAASVGDKALFAGGSIGAGATTFDVVDIYDDSTGMWSTTTLSHDRQNVAAATIADRAYFAGGDDCCGNVDNVDVYDATSNNWSVLHLPLPRSRAEAAVSGDELLIAGGGAGGLTDRVDIYDVGTGTWSVASLSVPRAWHAATSVGGRAVFAGGLFGNDVVDIYEPCVIGAYCTAKSGLVCGMPSIGFLGTPSITASSGFVIDARPARSNRAGLFLYTDQGAANIPFQGGTLCVAPPLSRSVPVNSGGGAGCGGVFQIDWNAFAQGLLGGTPQGFLLSPGQHVQVQVWGRDSLATGSFLSDALEYVACD